MNFPGYISKATGGLLLTAILYMHLCSALCSAGSFLVCTEEIAAKLSVASSSCCKKNPAQSEENDNSCQTTHLSFFTTTGQYHLLKGDDVIKAFQSLSAILVPALFFKSFTTKQSFFAYNEYDLPPPKADMRILFQSFLI